MSILRFDVLILAVVIAGALIAGVYLFILAIPRNDDEHVHLGISEPGHSKTWFLRTLARLRRRFTR